MAEATAIRRGLLVLASLLAAAICGCGPRKTFDPYDHLCVGPIKVAPRCLAVAATATADLARAFVHYLRFGGEFRDVETCTATANGTTVVLTAEVLDYTPDAGCGALGAILGGTARGNALIRYEFHDARGRLVWDDEIRSVARSGAGWFRDVPPPLGVDATIEGAAAELQWWMRRQKSNPGEAAREPVEDARRPSTGPPHS